MRLHVVQGDVSIEQLAKKATSDGTIPTIGGAHLSLQSQEEGSVEVFNNASKGTLKGTKVKSCDGRILHINELLLP